MQIFILQKNLSIELFSGSTMLCFQTNIKKKTHLIIHGCQIAYLHGSKIALKYFIDEILPVLENSLC